MSSARITQRLMVERSLSSLQLGLGRLSTAQEKLSTGRVINRPSDSPTGTNDAMRLRADLAANAQYSRNADDGSSWLGQADSTMTSMLDSVRRARDLMVQGASTGSAGTDARTALAAELTQIRSGLIDEANTTHLGRPLFGGTTVGPQAYDASGAYVGDTNSINRTVGKGVSVAVNVTGPAAFSSGTDDLFTVLSDAIDQLQNNPSAVSGTLTRLDAVSGSMRNALADIGTRANRIDTATSALASSKLDNTKSLSDVENVDVASAIVDLQMQEVAYQAALGATSRVLQPTLLDFLR
ncbi:flagellar hook-associated protein FlgL [Nocardioides panacis]|uniref:Flagellar hook-associated protein FlgL n=1 Tax=Nocardioides panacis TaxID=2849501 RepID=A0A975T086_9ACTN|nr:flagellar hook-associated protein FlgL [Nocardioides panacis]QWZ08478.1 flagellar hook-associated protein FlgL [Nocardioides panacis]